MAVAAHLSQCPLGERFGLPALARRYRQDEDALEQVRVVVVDGWVGGSAGRGRKKKGKMGKAQRPAGPRHALPLTRSLMPSLSLRSPAPLPCECTTGV